MAVLEILTYPHPLLRQPAQGVLPEAVTSPSIQTLIEDMLETLKAHPGCVGLAAPQVGASVQILVMHAAAKTGQPAELQGEPIVVINPFMTQQSQWKYTREGCLSFPDYLVTVKRARKLTLDWLDPNGIAHTAPFRDFEAIILQHEIDHLHGILFIDRVRSLETDLLRRAQTTLAQPTD